MSMLAKGSDRFVSRHLVPMALLDGGSGTSTNTDHNGNLVSAAMEMAIATGKNGTIHWQ